MFFRRVYDDGLAQASYIIGCQQNGEAVVIDPSMDIDSYLRISVREGLNIVHVAETHIHADFASGAQALAAATGAALHLPAEGGPDWRYEIINDKNVHELREGSRISVGNVHLDTLHTPGHTPEHVSFLVTDSARSETPVGALTGDFIFVGDVGRPDLLEVAAGQANTMGDSAATLYHSVQRFKKLAPHLIIWPGHGAGSACGKSMGAAEYTTLGYEKIANWALADITEQEFVDRVLKGQPLAPPYFGAMKFRNKSRITNQPSLQRRVEPADLAEVMSNSTPRPFLVDVRNRNEWDKGNIPQATLIPLPELHTRLDELPRDRPLIVHCQHGSRSAQAAATLDAFGFSSVHDLAGGYARWTEEGQKG